LAQLKVIFDIYGTLSKHTMVECIDREFSGNLKKGLLTLGLAHAGVCFWV
jgi:hypothetical protein